MRERRAGGTSGTWASRCRQRAYERKEWQQEAGPTVFAPFPQASEYFGSPQHAWMVNFRVKDLDRMVAQLAAAGIEVTLELSEPCA
jgi:hypothetical protein